MKFQLQKQTGQSLFTGYGAGYVMVNTVRYERSLVVTPECVDENWRVESFDKLDANHFEYLCALKPEIVLLGTGTVMRFPSRALSHRMLTARIGLEVMDTPAACRTFNILMAEGRNVVAAVLPA